jgi:hypothetical protein
MPAEMVTDAIIQLHGEFYTNFKSHTIQNIRYQLP